jgi:enoyl-CoA hydratase
LDYETLLLTREGAVATLVLNRPPLNPLNAKMFYELEAACGELEADPEVRAVILCGAGERAFAAGADVSELAAQAPLGAHSFCRASWRAFKKLEDLPKATVAALQGLVFGGGMELAYCCDFRLAADNARFAQPEINLAIIPGGGGTQRLPRLIGLARAKELLFLGETIDAATALQYGLVHRVVPAQNLMSEARALAEKLAAKPPVALQTLKRVMQTGMEVDLGTGLQFETEGFVVNFTSEDAREGLQAFMEKRQPVFRGR